MAFRSAATNLVADDTNGVWDIFVRDTVNGITTRVSVDSDGNEVNGASDFACISSNGLFVAFTSDASGLVTGDTNGRADTFLHDMVTGATTRVSVSSTGTEGNSDSYNNPSLSADGRYVAFRSLASNLVAGDTNATSDIFLRDTLNLTTTRVSVTSSGTGANGYSDYPNLSPDGRYVAFRSSASNLVSGDTNARDDIFLHDTLNGVTTRVSLAAGGAQANGTSDVPFLSTNARYMVFQSLASNLVRDDTNGKSDIFVRSLWNEVPVSAGWNLVAGGPGSDLLGRNAFGYSGSAYASSTGETLEAGKGYWVKFDAPGTAGLTVVPAPLSVHLVVGWNLIGNTTADSLALPAGLTAFVFEAGSYASRTVLAPGQGAWVKSASDEVVVLEKAVIPTAIALVSADGAESLIGLTHQYTFKVTQADETAAPGVTVDAAALTGPGYVGGVEPASAVSDVNGEVTFTVASSEVGVEQVSAAVDGVAVPANCTTYWLALDEVFVTSETLAATNPVGTSQTWYARVLVFGPGPLSTGGPDWYNIQASRGRPGGAVDGRRRRRRESAWRCGRPRLVRRRTHVDDRGLRGPESHGHPRDVDRSRRPGGDHGCGTGWSHPRWGCDGNLVHGCEWSGNRNGGIGRGGRLLGRRARRLWEQPPPRTAGRARFHLDADLGVAAPADRSDREYVDRRWTMRASTRSACATGDGRPGA